MSNDTSSAFESSTGRSAGESPRPIAVGNVRNPVPAFRRRLWASIVVSAGLLVTAALVALLPLFADERAADLLRTPPHDASKLPPTEVVADAAESEPFPVELFTVKHLTASSALEALAEREAEEARVAEEKARARTAVQLLAIAESEDSPGDDEALLYLQEHDRIVGLRTDEGFAGWRVEEIQDGAVRISTESGATATLTLVGER